MELSRELSDYIRQSIESFKEGNEDAAEQCIQFATDLFYAVFPVDRIPTRQLLLSTFEGPIAALANLDNASSQHLQKFVEESISQICSSSNFILSEICKYPFSM